MKFIHLAIAALSLWLCSCATKIQPTDSQIASALEKPVWPRWTSEPVFKTPPKKTKIPIPNTISICGGHVQTYGARDNGSEEFIIFSKRNTPKPRELKLATFSFELGGLDHSMLHKLANENGNSYQFIQENSRSTKFHARPATGNSVKGTFVYCTSIVILSKPEELLLKRMRSLGWNTLAVLPSDSLFGGAVPFYSGSSRPIQASIKHIAKDTDRMVAHQASATRIALAYLEKSRPSWSTGKQVLAGGSAGTFALPAIAARTSGWDAAILIGGSTGVLDAFSDNALGFSDICRQIFDEIHPKFAKTMETKNYTMPTGSEYVALVAQATAHTRLDTKSLAPHLAASTPVLQIDARFDRIIPRTQANALHRALGKPERWNYPTGHGLLFYLLPSQANRIDRWIHRNS